MSTFNSSWAIVSAQKVLLLLLVISKAMSSNVLFKILEILDAFPPTSSLTLKYKSTPCLHKLIYLHLLSFLKVRLHTFVSEGFHLLPAAVSLPAVCVSPPKLLYWLADLISTH